MIKATIINNINIERLMKQINPLIDNASAVVANELTRLGNQFTPYMEGDLLNSMKLVKEGNRYTGIEYTVPYAPYVYYGFESWNWTVDKHPNASPRWLHRAFDIYKKNILAAANKTIKGGL